MKIETAAPRLEALGSPSRLRIYRLLVRAGEGGMPVGGIQDELGFPASTLSHHLRRLVDRGLVTQERQGTTLVCRADFLVMNELVGFLVDECCSRPSPSSG
ncbi:metalloregulator ArsR/SmtB family transcription factor [Aureimonas sp. SA4125]|uniref:ArsR/SmtB family transcription factor n=1 Tax=Aureimonas sp. SA4125 TaxID=2826993 RepID=UPI001CC829C6|nr:metalloregulator ArsR/SmtB family transcription factor [Aureimonas sp. SA4125]